MHNFLLWSSFEGFIISEDVSSSSYGIIIKFKYIFRIQRSNPLTIGPIIKALLGSNFSELFRSSLFFKLCLLSAAFRNIYCSIFKTWRTRSISLIQTNVKMLNLPVLNSVSSKMFQNIPTIFAIHIKFKSPDLLGKRTRWRRHERKQNQVIRL